MDVLLHKMADMPALVIPLMEGRPEGKDAFEPAWRKPVTGVVGWNTFNP